MASLFKTSTIWIVDYLYEGRPRRWVRPAPQGHDLAAEAAALLADTYGPKAVLQQARPATADEEREWLRGEGAPTAWCPTARP